MNLSPAAGLRFRPDIAFLLLRPRSIKPASTAATWPRRTTKTSTSPHGSCPRSFSRIFIPSTRTAASPTISAMKSPTNPPPWRFLTCGAANWMPAMRAARARPFSSRSQKPSAPAPFQKSRSPICSSPFARTRLSLATKLWTTCSATAATLLIPSAVWCSTPAEK